MMRLPKAPKPIRAQIKRYERTLAQEHKTFGAIRDGAGHRYWLGPLYLVLDDLPGALQSFAWFAQTFPDDRGEPLQYLCWSLALYRNGQLEAAVQKLRQTMLMNLYLLPHLLGLHQAPLAIWHGSNWAEASYLQWVPPEFFALWDEAALRWAQERYVSLAFTQVRTRYIELCHQLQTEPPGPMRQQLVNEVFVLQAKA